MKGNEKVIEQLNTRLSEEFAAIHQYTLHAAMQENWGTRQLSREEFNIYYENWKHLAKGDRSE